MNNHKNLTNGITKLVKRTWECFIRTFLTFFFGMLQLWVLFILVITVVDSKENVSKKHNEDNKKNIQQTINEKNIHDHNKNEYNKKNTLSIEKFYSIIIQLLTKLLLQGSFLFFASAIVANSAIEYFDSKLKHPKWAQYIFLYLCPFGILLLATSLFIGGYLYNNDYFLLNKTIETNNYIFLSKALLLFSFVYVFLNRFLSYNCNEEREANSSKEVNK